MNRDGYLNESTPRLHYTDRGTADDATLVLLHGLQDCAANWDGAADRLEDRYRVVTLDLRGHGDSGRSAEGAYSQADFSNDIGRLLKGLDLGPAVLVGHSFGGMVAAEVAATNPKRVSKLVLLSSIGLWRDDTPVKNWMSMAPEALVKEVFYEPNSPLAKRIFGLPEDPEERVTAQIQGTWNLACTGKFVWPIPDKGLKKRLHRIQAPTLVVWGQHDGLVPPIYAQEFTDRIAGSRAEIIDKASHVPQLEQLETVSRIVQDFLKS